MISIISPVFEEQNGIKEFVNKIQNILKKIDHKSEIILIDDGSKDFTNKILLELYKKYKNIKVIVFEKNYGHQNAILAGLKKSTGDIIVTIDSDLQDPPEIIFKLLEKYNEGYEIVNTQRIKRKGEKVVRLFLIKFFYLISRKIFRNSLIPNSGDFRLYSRRAINFILEYSQSNFFLRSIVPSIGVPQTIVKYNRNPRFADKSKYNIFKLINFSIDALITSSGFFPRFILFSGLIFSFISILIIFFFIINDSFYASIFNLEKYILLFIMLAISLNLTLFGYLGEFLQTILNQTKNTKKYFIKDIYE